MTDFLLNDLGWSLEKLLDLRTRLLDKADSLAFNYDHYQMEVHLEHLSKGHRRALEGFVKIIYRIEGEVIFITDFFDTRQDPSKMKG